MRLNDHHDSALKVANSEIILKRDIRNKLRCGGGVLGVEFTFHYFRTELTDAHVGAIVYWIGLQ